MTLSTIEAPAIGLEDIIAARERLRGAIYYSPCPQSQMLSKLTGQNVYLKLENLQMTGSFKERGALNRIALLTPEQARRGVIAASAGNHAQGVAYHATARGIRALIVMPLATPLVKVTATRNFGAEVLLHGANYDEACAEATRLAAEQDLTFIHPFDDPAVMAGQGTIGLELLEQIPQLEAVVVPIGGGGLIGGIACAIKQSRPSVRVIGVQTTRLPSMAIAKEQYEAAIATRPNYVPARIQLGVTLLSMGDPEGAAQQWNKVIEIDPENSRAKMYLRMLSLNKMKSAPPAGPGSTPPQAAQG